jgi:PAS domain-containing protein
MEREDYEKNEVVTKSGKRKLIYWNNALIKDEVGQIKELLCSGIDITERKHSEEALIKVKDEFHLLAESMPQIVWVALPNGLNIYLNQQWVNYRTIFRRKLMDGLNLFILTTKKSGCLAKCHCI